VNGASVLAIVDGHELSRRDRDGLWTRLAESALPLSCCVQARGEVFVGTNNDAHLLRLDSGALRPVDSLAHTPGREGWYAGAALVDGKWMGPPLCVRSLSASADGEVLLVNVHVGGIPRSIDGGATWLPTIHVDADVHQVACHPTRPEIAAAAAAAGLCLSRDGGARWTIETAGLHAHYCSAVAFVDDDVYVAASADHFAEAGAVYRRAIDGTAPLARVDGGMPQWTSRIVDTDGIAARGRNAAIVDGAGNVYLSSDGGRTWARLAQLPSGASCAAFF
jgi:photosystem II stability/assembly factor-like uncharacterized protein